MLICISLTEPFMWKHLVPSGGSHVPCNELGCFNDGCVGPETRTKKKVTSFGYKEVKKFTFSNFWRFKVSHQSSMILIPHPYSAFNFFVKRIKLGTFTTPKYIRDICLFLEPNYAFFCNLA